MKLDVLAFGAHPDDVELSCSGTISKLKAQGKKVGIIDLTRGELGTRGTAEIRDREAAASARILGLEVRENLGFRDGFFVEDEVHQIPVIKVLRKYQPEIILINAPHDRHPDHAKGSGLVRNAAFLSGLRRIKTTSDGEIQQPWHPKKIFKYIQDFYLEPSFVFDISEHWETKMAAIRAFASQFYDPDSDEPSTYISSPNFLKYLESRCREFGHRIRTTYGEGFVSETIPKVDDLFSLI